ncbi:Lmo0850 family protein [Metasolibacillus sp. FSL H7-0170]|nr:Lmo0850 family protein [Metasolibacillus fluoroglycofenilyticus]
MAKEIDLKKIVSNLSKLGVNATVTKSRIELLKVLTPPVQSPQAQQA